MYYFIEALHYAGISDEQTEELKKVLEFNPKWVNEFNAAGANPVLVSLQEGNCNNFCYMKQNYTIDDKIKNQFYLTAFEIKVPFLQGKIVEQLLLDNSLDKDFTWKHGKKMPHLLARGTSSNIDLAKKFNIDFKSKDINGNDWFEDFFQSDFKLLDDKLKLFDKMIRFYTVDELLEIKVNGEDLEEKIDSRKKEASFLREVIKNYITESLDN